MCRLIETIRIKNGTAENLKYHQNRINFVFENLFRGCTAFNITDYLRKIALHDDGIYKCRILYDDHNIKHQIIKYNFPVIHSLKIVIDDSIDYTYKYADRSRLEYLFSNREHCDDILIIKNGNTTDSYFANIIFFDGSNWFTPKYPLLKGTKREKYLSEGKIFEKIITLENLKDYKYAKLINAMLDIEDTVSIDISQIYSQ